MQGGESRVSETTLTLSSQTHRERIYSPGISWPFRSNTLRWAPQVCFVEAPRTASGHRFAAA
jgi:hypothetical protein